SSIPLPGGDPADGRYASVPFADRVKCAAPLVSAPATPDSIGTAEPLISSRVTSKGSANNHPWWRYSTCPVGAYRQPYPPHVRLCGDEPSILWTTRQASSNVSTVGLPV